MVYCRIRVYTVHMEDFEKKEFNPENSDDRKEETVGNEFHDQGKEAENDTGNNWTQSQNEESAQPNQSQTYYSQGTYGNSQGYYGSYQQNGQQGSPQYPYYGASQYQQTPAPEKKKGGRKGLKILCVLVALIVVATGVTVAVHSKRNSSADSSGNATAINEDGPSLEINDTPTVNSASTGKALSTTEIAKIARESSVGILVYSNNTSYYSSKSENNKSGEGTGIVMGYDSTKTYTYVITCAHVISDANVTVKVMTEDGTTYDAEIVGYDVQTDVGVVKVKTTKLTPATFGDSSALAVGEPVYAVGNPGGSEFFGSFTGGYVSAIGRSIDNEIGYTMKCIQHDAAINPGNSGGALLNSYGQVIGINSSKIASTEYEGMSFSIPIGTAKEIIDNLITYGYVPNRPKLGISYSTASSYQQYAMVVQIKGLPSGSLIVRKISKDSDLANTDVQIGDLITKVNGKELTTSDILFEVIDKSKVGDTVTLSICRINNDYSIKEFEVKVKLVEDKGNTQAEDETTTINPFDYFSQFGNGQ